MNASTEIIMPNVVLTCLQTDKFKTGSLSINLLTSLNAENASKNALIPYVLRRGTATLPDMAAISRKFDSLYGARIKPVIRKKGEIQTVGFFADFADDKFLPNGNNLLSEITGLLGEMLLMPNTHGGLLRREYVESEREKLIEKIRAGINNKRSYSMKRLFEQMCSMEDYSVGRFGSEQSAEVITPQSLTKHYHELIANSPVEIFYCGSSDPKLVKKIIRNVLSAMPRADEKPDLGTDIRMNSLEEKPRYFEDQLNVTQGKLAIGFRLGDCMLEPNTAAIKVFNAVYGGSVTSKLFMNVREKLSLCYFASSGVDLHKGIMAVSSGIEFDKYDSALNEILAQLDNVKEGNFDDFELTAAKSSVASDYRTIEDNPVTLEDYYLTQILIGPDCSPLELASLTEEVTKQQVIDIAKGVELDAIYFLRGPKEEQ